MATRSRRSERPGPRRASDATAPDETTATNRLSSRARHLLVAAGAIAGTAVVGGTVNFFLPSVLGRTQQPLLIDVEDDPAAVSTFADGSQSVALPETDRGKDLGSPDAQGCTDFHRWATQLGAVDAGATRFRVTVQGNDSRPVLISQLRVKVLQRDAATEGAYAVCETAGDASIRAMSVDLDGISPVVRPAEGTKTPFGVTVGQGEIELFDVEATTGRADVVTRWVLELTVTVDGHAQVIDVEDRGHPFATTGKPPATAPRSSWLTGWRPGPPFA